ncbi:unnamed protein product [Dimorphilus gyrociliatus]|uniref:Uncharacterized protein n=1 Tax=Dimorphilus gyrociliatus TaxID=2664684 RepID=A0A7I8VL75_9ANNE|nr:unnamed protein product [Dimorphilus gyrociliatus]
MENAKRTLSITANQNINEPLMECDEKNLPSQVNVLRIVNVGNILRGEDNESKWLHDKEKLLLETKSSLNDQQGKRDKDTLRRDKEDLISFSCPKPPVSPLLWDHIIEHKVNNIEKGDRCEPYPSCGCPQSNNPASSPRFSEYSIDFDTDSEDSRPSCCNFTEYKINNLEGCAKNQAVPVCQGACEFRCIDGTQESSTDCLPYSLIPTLSPFSNKVIKEEQELSVDLVSSQITYLESSV